MQSNTPSATALQQARQRAANPKPGFHNIQIMQRTVDWLALTQHAGMRVNIERMGPPQGAGV